MIRLIHFDLGKGKPPFKGSSSCSFTPSWIEMVLQLFIINLHHFANLTESFNSVDGNSMNTLKGLIFLCVPYFEQGCGRGR